jgi:hypothetical protein
MATNRNFQFEGMTQIKRKLTNAGFTLIPLRHLMNEHAEVITKEAKKVAPKDYLRRFKLKLLHHTQSLYTEDLKDYLVDINHHHLREGRIGVMLIGEQDHIIHQYNR